MAFIENKGQILNQDFEANNDVLYLYSGKGIKVQLRKSGYSYELFTIENTPDFKACVKNGPSPEALKNIRMKGYRVDVDFVGMNSDATVIAEQRSDDYLNYYVCGHDAEHVYAYNKVIYKNAYKNTDIEFIINEQAANPLKYNIILHPGADINLVKFLIKGATRLVIDNNALDLGTPLGTIRETIPLSYYTNSPAKNEEVSFALNKNTLSFSAAYDPAKTLIIDPSSSLIWATYYSGPSIDYCSSTRVDAADNVYIAGYTFSTTDIATNNSFQYLLNGSLDAYLAKFNPNGVRQWATYFGGSSVEQIYAMHIGTDGSVYLTGDTFSTSNIATPGAHQMVYGGGQDDVLLVKFDTSGARIWATYLGGTEHEFAQAVTTDADLNVVIGGHTRSSNGMATPGAYSTVYNFDEEGFIAKFTANGVLLWCTYYGDSGNDIVYSVACDAAKNVYATGISSSISNIATNGSFQPNISGGVDAFLARFNSIGTTLDWATYYGGTNYDEGTAVRMGPGDILYLTGNTSSAVGNFTSQGCYQPAAASAEDGFLASFTSAGVRLWGTYFGGNATDYISDMVLDANTNLVFSGETLSTDVIATAGAAQPSLSTAGNYDAYFFKFSKLGLPKLGTYFGFYSNENARGVCVDKTGKVYIAGETTSTVGLATAAAHQTVSLGSQDGFLAKFCMDIEPIVTPANTTVCAGPTTISAVNGYSTYLWSNGATVNPIVVTTNTTIGTYQFTVYVTDGFGCTGSSSSMTIQAKKCVAVGVEEYEHSNLFRLYPVPSADHLVIELNDEAMPATQLEIYSITGQLIRTVNDVQSTTTIDIRDIKPGIYLLRSRINGQDVYFKFIKE